MGLCGVVAGLPNGADAGHSGSPELSASPHPAILAYRSRQHPKDELKELDDLPGKRSRPALQKRVWVESPCHSPN